MPISYGNAVRLIEIEADTQSPNFQNGMETVQLDRALNRTCGRTYSSPDSTPRFDTSAMDGYALSSEATKNVSVECPAMFSVRGTIAAGDEPLQVSGEPDSKGVYPCVEIMTGARFPDSSAGMPFDCCVRHEDTTAAMNGGPSDSRHISITKAAKYQQNRRFAGGDFNEGDGIIQRGSTIQTRHIMALASVGHREISVYRKPRVAIYSTGAELDVRNLKDLNCHKIRDVNGPYCSATLESWGAEADFLGLLGDDAVEIGGTIGSHLDGCKYDLIITTGAVSAGKFDLVRAGIERVGASVLFHKVSMRPGHPALFASIRNPSEESSRIPFFGLPGNPVASAACLRFMVHPYLRRLQSQKPERPLKADVRGTDKTSNSNNHRKAAQGEVISSLPPDKDVFRLGIYGKSVHNQKLEVKLIEDHSPGKIKPFLWANCWIHIPASKVELRNGDMVDIFPIS